MENFNSVKDRLLYRRQFILGPYFIKRLKNWRRIKINNTTFLTIHPDLTNSQAIYKKKSLTLLGFILDPENPHLNDFDIINKMVQQVKKFNDLFKLTDSMGGRWILIYNDGNNLILFNDAVGLRQVFYFKDESYMWCASQPGIIAEELDLNIDEETLKNFIRTPAVKNNVEYWWPSNTSPFMKIKHLLPNHYLNLEKGICYRYWPYEKLTEVSLKQCINISSTLLKGLMISAHNRYNLALPITAGLDSRLLLAACKDFNKDIYYYTISFRNKRNPDVKIPNDLLTILGLKHDIIECFSLDFNIDFLKIYKRNVSTAHDKWCLIAQTLFKKFPKNTINIKGNVNETTRCNYPQERARLKKGDEITAEKIAKIAKMENNTYAIKYFNEWLIEVKDITEKYNVNILDLYHWENRNGNWQAMAQLEWDIIHETFSPYNCRKYLTTLLSIEEKYREGPSFLLHKKLIKNIWEKVLIQPINPPSSILNIFLEIINYFISYIKLDFYNSSMFRKNIMRLLKSNPIVMRPASRIERIFRSSEGARA